MGSYHYYDDETCTKSAKYLCDYGNKVLLESSLLGLACCYREYSTQYEEGLPFSAKMGKDPYKIKSLAHASSGRPLLLRGYGM